MPALRCTHPMNGAATKAANADFYANHPEMIVHGKRVPIDPCDERQAKYRKEWVKSYGQNGGKVEVVRGRKIDECREDAIKTFKPAPVASPVKNCPNSKPKSNPAPVRKATPPYPKTPPCELLKTTMTCSHGRHAGPSGKLMVVSKAATGDTISVNSSMNGSCGTHPAWSVGGFWDSEGKGTSFSFRADKWAPSVVGLFALKSVDPHIYRVDTSACSGAAGAWQVEAYPGGEISYKVDPTKFKTVFEKVFQYLNPKHGHGEEDEEEGNGCALSDWEVKAEYKGNWEEEDGSWEACYKMEANGNVKVNGHCKAQIYPPSLVPGWLAKYVKAGLFGEIKLEFSGTMALKGKYTPENGKTHWPTKSAGVGGAGTLALSIEAKFVSASFAEGAVVGETGLEAKLELELEDELAMPFSIGHTGLKGKAVLKAAWGLIEWERSFQLISPGEFFKINLLGHTNP